MNAKDENEDTVQTAAHNPFPEPQTIPSGWDTTGFCSEPIPGSEVQAKDLSKNESD